MRQLWRSPASGQRHPALTACPGHIDTAVPPQQAFKAHFKNKRSVLALLLAVAHKISVENRHFYDSTYIYYKQGLKYSEFKGEKKKRVCSKSTSGKSRNPGDCCLQSPEICVRVLSAQPDLSL